mgnify:CR=1 FL=1
MRNTIVYLIRHAETVTENGIRNTNEDSQSINEKEILSVEGEEQAKRLSENKELQNLNVIWSSNYTRAKATAKYISNVNNLPLNLDSDLGERKLGNLKELGEFMKDKATRDPSQEQLLDRTFRTSDGESAEQTRERMNKFFAKILKEYCGKRIAVVSHGGSIKFFLLNWCKVNKDVKLVYNNEKVYASKKLKEDLLGLNTIKLNGYYGILFNNEKILLFTSFSKDDNILTLSTCSNNNKYRVVLHSKKLSKMLTKTNSFA